MCHYYWEGGKTQTLYPMGEREEKSVFFGISICFLGCPPEKITLNKRAKTCYPSTTGYFWEKRKTKVYYLATVVRRELNDTTVQSLDNTTPRGWDFPAGNSTRIYVCLYNSMAKTATANTQQQHHHQQQQQQQ